jgi:predicted AlkP superfamily phosphohydrolase/phosphomutase
MKKPRKIIIVGIDGFDPAILEHMMGRGELPNFCRLAEKGIFNPMQTAFPPQSPVAWTTIATGCNPTEHGIYDFLTLKPGEYSPTLAILRQGKLTYIPAHQTKTFWEIAAENDIPSTILKWPLTFPATPSYGNTLSGLGTPDILGTLGRYTFYTSQEVSMIKEKKGTIKKVDLLKGVINTDLTGPITLAFQGTKPAITPLKIELDDGGIKCHISDQSFFLKQGCWSDWIHVDFKVGFLRHVRGMCRFYLCSITPDFNLYVTPINISCQTKTMPISAPLGYAKEVAAAIGDYSTLGLAEDANALKDRVIDEQAFLSGCDLIMAERERIFFHALQDFREGLLACVFDTPDRIQHMFWRYLDKDHPLYNEAEAQVFGQIIPDNYRYMDGILGKTLERVDGDTLIIVCSDHGFTSFRWSVHLNTWLTQNGFMKLNQGQTEGRDLFLDVDWSGTSAFALGLNSIFINVKGRERQGTVDPEALPLIKEELVRKLKSLTNDAKSVIKNIYLPDQPLGHKTDHQAPDLIVGYDDGYRTSWQTAVGGTPSAQVIEQNLDKWSGDHCCDPEIVPATFLSNERNLGAKLHAREICPTILDYLGIRRNPS